MIRLIQRRLIIPRGDTGTFQIPMLPGKNAGDVSIFTVFDPLSHRKLLEKSMTLENEVLSIQFSHNDTVNLPVGQFVWDIKFYSNPVFADGKLVDGEEVDSYYAAFTLPVCEIRQTGDMMLMVNDAALPPDQLDILLATLNATTAAKNEAVTSAAEADTSATNAENSASAALASQQAALDSQTAALASQQAAAASAQQALASAELATIKAEQIATDISNKADKSEIPTKVSDLEDDSGHYTKPAGGIPAADLAETYLTTHQDISGKANSADLATVATSGDYDDLLNKPTIPEVPVQDVQINGNSILENGVANIPPASYSNGQASLGLVKAYGLGITVDSTGEIALQKASDAQIKRGSGSWAPIVASNEHLAAFYGLAKAAGADEKNSELSVGTYTDTAKIAIQQMLGVPAVSAIPTSVSQLTNDAGYLTSYTETDPTVPSWAKAAQKPTYTAAEVGAPTVQEMNTAIGNAIGNINSFDMTVVQELPSSDISTHTIYLVPKTGETNDVYDEYVYINSAWEMVGNTQIDLSNYATKNEIPEVPVQDVQVNGVSILQNGIANVPNATNSTLGLVTKMPASSNCIDIQQDGSIGVYAATSSAIKTGTNTIQPIVPSKQHGAVFYGLAKAAGDTTQSQSDNAVGTYTTEAKAAIRSMLGAAASADVTVQDVQINGTSILSNNIANISIASAGSAGVIKVSSAYGIGMLPTGYAVISPAGDDSIKTSTQAFKPITPSTQHKSVFYGLAKAAGDTTQSQSDNAVGTYTAAAQTAIQNMLGVPSNNIIAIQSAQPTSPDTKIWVDQTEGTTVQVPTIDEMNAADALKANKTDTVLLTTLSMGRKAGTTVGTGSIALGNNIEASGNYSIATGTGTIANANNSFVTGIFNSPAVEYPNWVSGTHYNIGDRVMCPVIEDFILPRECIKENSDTTWTSSKWKFIPAVVNADLIYIVGNGTSTAARSNAYALDWFGNAKYAGDVYAHANADSTGGTRLATITELAAKLDAAEAGLKVVRLI